MSKNNVEKINEIFDKSVDDLHLNKDDTQLIFKNTSNRVFALSNSDNSKEFITHINMTNNMNYIIVSINDINSLDLYDKINNLYSRDKREDIIEGYKKYLIEEGANKHSVNSLNPILDILNSREDVQFNKEEEDMLLQFIVSHELGHSVMRDLKGFDPNNVKSSSDRVYDNDYVNKINSSLETLNKSVSFDKQQFGANYLAMRWEIISDVAGIYSVYKNNGKTEEADMFLDKFREKRYFENYSMDVNAQGNHNTEIAFNKKYKDEINKLAQSNPGKEELYENISKISDNVFVDTLKKYGVGVQTENTTRQMKKYKNKGIEDIYIDQSNKATKELSKFKDKCDKNPISFRISCDSLENGIMKNKVSAKEEIDTLSDYLKENDIKLSAADKFRVNIYQGIDKYEKDKLDVDNQNKENIVIQPVEVKPFKLD